jgi:hypothetical protein
VKATSGIAPRLGPISLGASFAIYFFMQYLATPIGWWAAQRTSVLAWMNDIFVSFDLQGLDPFTPRSVVYSLYGLAAFAAGYAITSARIPALRSARLDRPWPVGRAVFAFWVLFLGGFGLKAYRLLTGADVSAVAPNTVFADSTVAFVLSLNWLHWASVAVINVVYQEARRNGDARWPRLRVLAYCATTFVLAVSLTSASRLATIVPLAAVVVIRQFYAPLPAATLLRRGAVLALVLLAFKGLLMTYIHGSSSSTDDAHPVRFELFYSLIHRVNLSWVLATVIEEGQQAYPDGTLGQFVTEMLPYGMERTNVFDGNEFGRELSLIQEADTSTGIAVTNIGDLYINGGIPGIVAGMLLCGVLFRTLVSLAQSSRPGPVLLYSLMWPICLHGTESPVSVFWAASLKMAALCLVVHLGVTASGAEVPDRAGVREGDLRVA